MVYEVEFMDSQFITIQTALIHAENVTECKEMAGEIASEIPVKEEDLRVSIEEFEE